MNAAYTETSSIKDTWNEVRKLSNWVDAAPDKKHDTSTTELR